MDMYVHIYIELSMQFITFPFLFSVKSFNIVMHMSLYLLSSLQKQDFIACIIYHQNIDHILFTYFLIIEH